MSNRLDPDQAQCVGPHLGPNCLQKLSADTLGFSTSSDTDFSAMFINLATVWFDHCVVIIFEQQEKRLLQHETDNTQTCPNKTYHWGLFPLICFLCSTCKCHRHSKRGWLGYNFENPFFFKFLHQYLSKAK